MILVIRKQSVLSGNVVSSPKNFNGGFFSDCRNFLNIFINMLQLCFIMHICCCLVPFHFNVNFNFDPKFWVIRAFSVTSITLFFRSSEIRFRLPFDNPRLLTDRKALRPSLPFCSTSIICQVYFPLNAVHWEAVRNSCHCLLGISQLRVLKSVFFLGNESHIIALVATYLRSSSMLFLCSRLLMPSDFLSSVQFLSSTSILVLSLTINRVTLQRS